MMIHNPAKNNIHKDNIINNNCNSTNNNDSINVEKKNCHLQPLTVFSHHTPVIAIASHNISHGIDTNMITSTISYIQPILQ